MPEYNICDYQEELAETVGGSKHMMPVSQCPIEGMAREALHLVDRLYRNAAMDASYMTDSDRLGLLEQQASFLQAMSHTGALQQIALAAQCADRIDEERLTPFEQQSLRELQRHLVSLARFMVANGADLERTYVKALMPAAV